MTPSLSIRFLPRSAQPQTRNDPLGLGVLIDAHLEAVGNIRGKAFAKHSTDPLTNEAADFRRAPICKLGQHGSGHALLAVPADAVSLAEAEPQSREELGSDHGVDAHTYTWLLL